MTGALVTEVRAQAWTVPTDAPEADGTMTWDATTVLVVHLRANGLTGLGWSYTDSSAVQVVRGLLGDAVTGRDVLDLPSLHAALVGAARNVGSGGVVASAISAIDIAAWDLKARLLGVSLVQLLGRAQDVAPAYGSGGFTTWDDARTQREIEAWAEQGCAAVKIKIGEGRGTQVSRDLDRAALAARSAGNGVEVFTDANGGYSRGQAVRVGRALDGLGVTWFEEPVTSDDPAGLAAVRQLVACDVTAGEYIWQPWDAHRLLAVGAVDCLQLDATRCGGVTGWLACAAAAAVHGVPVSAHCAPQISAHLVAATPHARHLEWFYDHVRVAPLLFDGVLPLADGAVRPDTSRAGHGIGLRVEPADPARRVA